MQCTLSLPLISEQLPRLSSFVFHCSLCDHMEERGGREGELLGTRPHPLEGAIDLLRQENASLRSELSKLKHLVEERVKTEAEKM